MNQDFKEMFTALNEEGVEYLLVGAHAVAHYSVPRYTKDLDIWVFATPENARRVWAALARFGAPVSQIPVETFQDPNSIYFIGVPPYRIDFLTQIDGVTFEDAWPNRETLVVEGQTIPVISRADLIKNKKASGRPQDLLDVMRLEEEV